MAGSRLSYSQIEELIMLLNSASAGDWSFSPRQERISGWLLTQVGPGPAAFFRDACELVAAGRRLGTVTHLVAHALREVESSVRSVLEPVDAGAGAGGDGHRVRIRAVLDDLGISHDDAVAQFWLGMAGSDNQGSLAVRAHRLALDVPRPVDDEFLEFVDRFEQVLDAILERFESRYIQVFERLDVLLAKPVPTKTDVGAVRNNFPRTQVVAGYFFSRASAAWLDPLREAGCFSAPPPPEVDEDAGTAQIPWWPESEYLARIAANIPEAAVEAALTIPGTQNSRVHHDVVQIGLTVPANVAVRLVPKFVDAVKSRFGVWLPDQVGALVAHLARGGQAEGAMTLAGELLARLPARYGSASGVDAYEYGLILRQHVPALIEATGVPALAMLSNLLDEVVGRDLEQHRGRPDYDGSSVWRPSIEGQQGRAESDLRHGLVNAVRDAAGTIVDNHPSCLGDIVTELESHRWPIFRRLAMHLLSQHSEVASDLIAARLTDRATIQNWQLDREYLLLAHRSATCLGPARLRQLLTLIDEGPQPPRLYTAVSPTADQQVAQPMAPDHVAQWQRDRLAAIRVVLPPDRDVRYQALVAEYGDAPDPNLPAPESYALWSEIEAPISANQLAAMSTEALVEFLRTWQPPKEEWRPGWRPLSPASLRGALSSAVQNDAARWSVEAGAFIGLPPVYVGAVLNGMWQATQNGVVLNWDGVIELAEWINQQAVNGMARHSNANASREWREVRMDMLRLLITGLDLQPNPISPEFDTRLWSIIASCCEDPAPTAEEERDQAPQEEAGFLSLAHTAMRPQGLRAAIAYGLWLRRRSPDADLGIVRALLEKHLDPHHDPSRAVRSIYGELFAGLVWMDRDWAAQHVKAIFPLDSDQERLLDAAWDGYLGSTQLTTNAWNLLTDVYIVMVDRLGQPSPNVPEQFRTSTLGLHLINRLWNGQIHVESHNGLLRRYYRHAPAQDAAHLLHEIGTGLNELESPDSALIARLTDLWDFQVEAVRLGADAAELAEFGPWFASGHFDAQWSLRQLLVTFTLAGDIEADDAMLSKLADLASAHIQVCLTVLERWIRTAPHAWRLNHNIDNIRRILSIGQAGDLTAVTTSTKVISMLARDHGIDLRDLIPSGSHFLVW